MDCHRSYSGSSRGPAALQNGGLDIWASRKSRRFPLRETEQKLVVPSLLEVTVAVCAPETDARCAEWFTMTPPLM